MSTSLYTLSETFAALEAELLETGGEWTPEIEAAFAALGELETDKVDAYAVVVRGLERHRDACKTERDALQQKATAAEHAARRLKERMHEYLTVRGVRELKGTVWRAAIQAHGGKQPLEVLVPAEELPPDFQRVTVSADTDKLRAAAEAVADPGGEVTLTHEGTALARLLPRGSSVRFR